jgi:hypothetical protein
MDANIKRILAPAMGKQGKTMNLGIGDAGFAPTGRGEMAVPTTSFDHSIIRVLKKTWVNKKMRLEDRVRLLAVDEHKTTMGCHRCGSELKKILLIDGRECQRYRMCTECECHETVYKRRHRDVNAARNILKITECLVNGLPRPHHLCRRENHQH